MVADFLEVESAANLRRQTVHVENMARTLFVDCVYKVPPTKRGTMRAFAEREIYLPDGKYEGMRFQCSRNPFAELWFDLIDSGRWSRFVAVGPTQTGKTLIAFLIIILYHAFELRETVIVACPTVEIANDKWREDLLPIIKQTRFADLLPSKDPKLSKDMAIRLGNGATLKFMTAGGGDKARAGYTSRVVVFTELDAFDVVGGTSRESDKFTQLCARLKSHERSRQRIYMECTPSYEHGRTWAELKRGTDTRISLLCPHCKCRVTAENGPGDRKLLVGWEDRETVSEAMAGTSFACPHCGALWSESDRRMANADAVVVHRGMDLNEAGELIGEMPVTETLGFRWGPINNLLVPASNVGADEHVCEQAVDTDEASRALFQFTWALPFIPSGVFLDPETVMGRQDIKLVKGIVPPDCKWLTVGVDLGKLHSFYTVVAWCGHEGETSHVVDYGLMEVHSHELGVEPAVLGMLRELRDERCVPGWSYDGRPRSPDQVYIDSGWMPQIVYQFCLESGDVYRPCKGFGTGMVKHSYSQPSRTGKRVLFIGEEYHAAQIERAGVLLVEFNADHWKRWVQQRLSTPPGRRGSMDLFVAPRNDHRKFAMHITSEREVSEFVPGRGLVVRMKAIRGANHLLDSTALACVAGHACGARLTTKKQVAHESGVGYAAPRRFERPDGTPFLDLRTKG